MSVTYNTILRQVALAINAIDGTSPSTLEDKYNDVPLTSANFVSSIIPFTALKDKMLNAESNLVAIAAGTRGHPWRGSILEQTGELEYGNIIPASILGFKLLGNYGDVRDVATGEPLVEMPLANVQDRHINPNGMWKIPAYWYAINDRRIYHTTDGVEMDVCVYLRPSADTLNLTSFIALPDEAAPAYVYGTLMECIRDDEFMAQGARFGEMFEKWVGGIKAGFSTALSMTKESK